MLRRTLRDVAQLGRVHVWGACGRKFKSCRPDFIRLSFSDGGWLAEALVMAGSLSFNSGGQLFFRYQIYQLRFSNVMRLSSGMPEMIYFATVAQLVEQRIRNAWVSGSSPLGGSSLK